MGILTIRKMLGSRYIIMDPNGQDEGTQGNKIVNLVNTNYYSNGGAIRDCAGYCPRWIIPVDGIETSYITRKPVNGPRWPITGDRAQEHLNLSGELYVLPSDVSYEVRGTTCRSSYGWGDSGASGILQTSYGKTTIMVPALMCKGSIIRIPGLHMIRNNVYEMWDNVVEHICLDFKQLADGCIGYICFRTTDNGLGVRGERYYVGKCQYIKVQPTGNRNFDNYYYNNYSDAKAAYDALGPGGMSYFNPQGLSASNTSTREVHGYILSEIAKRSVSIAMPYGDLARAALSSRKPYDENILMFIGNCGKIAQTLLESVKPLAVVCREGRKAFFGNPKASFTTLTNSVLSGWYGVRLQFRQIKNFLKVGQAIKNFRETIQSLDAPCTWRGRLQDSIPSAWGPVSVTYNCKITTSGVAPGFCRGFLNRCSFLSATLLNLNWNTVWDFVPYSFCVNWFVNAQDLLSYCDSWAPTTGWRDFDISFEKLAHGMSDAFNDTVPLVSSMNIQQCMYSCVAVYPPIDFSRVTPSFSSLRLTGLLKWKTATREISADVKSLKPRIQLSAPKFRNYIEAGFLFSQYVLNRRTVPRK